MHLLCAAVGLLGWAWAVLAEKREEGVQGEEESAGRRRQR